MSEKFEGFPEHEKMSKVNHKSQAIFEFMEWVGGKYNIVLKDTEDNITFKPQLDLLLYEFLDVDKKKFEAEKEKMYQELKEAGDENRNKDIPN